MARKVQGGPAIPVRVVGTDRKIAGGAALPVVDLATGDVVTNVDSLQFNTGVATPAHSEGLVYWNSDAKTLDVMTNVDGTVLQVGQEMYMFARNNTGAQINNGQAVYISGATGNRPTIALARADAIATSVVSGLATANIANNADGWVTVYGVVRSINTNAFNEGDTLYLSPTTAGALQNTEPTQPNFAVKIGVVRRRNASNGEILLDGTRSLYVDTPVVFSEYIETNTRNLDQALHGLFDQLVTGSALNSGAPIAYTHGLGKVFIVMNAGADFDGTITVTGTTVDRNTGAETPADTENITIDALTTDNSDTDAEGNTRHAFTGAYMTTKWFFGAVTISTADTSFTDVDVYNVAFEQVNDTPVVTAITFDITLLCTNTLGWFYAYEYLLTTNTTTKKTNLARIASIALDVGDSEANRSYRLRRGNLAQSFDGTKDGFWVELFFGPTPQQYFDNITIKTWFTVRSNLA